MHNIQSTFKAEKLYRRAGPGNDTQVLRVKIACIALFVCLILHSCATKDLASSQRRRLQGKVFVVTGASSGFGKGVALKLGACGAHVVLAARRPDLLDVVADSIRSLGGQALVVPTDVTDYKAMTRLRDTTVACFGSIDVWINNAGVASIGRFWDVPLDEHVRVEAVNYLGVLYGSYLAIASFRKQGYGVLINLGSVESEIPVAYQSSYSASKAAVRSLGEVLHQELRLSGERNIKVVTIMPWAAKTPFWKHLGNHSGGTVSMIAMDDPEKIVNAVIYSSLHPQREQAVGWKAKVAVRTHRLFPHFTEWLTAEIAHKYQYKAPPAKPATSGNLFSPENETGALEIEVPHKAEDTKE